jgi:hypothetical protein
MQRRGNLRLAKSLWKESRVGGLQAETTNSGGEAMRQLVVVTAAVLCAAAVLSAPSKAAVGRGMAAAINAIDPVEKIGCYRLGETGYHWYRFCFGPGWLYPHQRVCRRGYCWYR